MVNTGFHCGMGVRYLELNNFVPMSGPKTHSQVFNVAYKINVNHF
jgi:hypothetical protein